MGRDLLANTNCYVLETRATHALFLALQECPSYLEAQPNSSPLQMQPPHVGPTFNALLDPSRRAPYQTNGVQEQSYKNKGA